MTGITGVNNQGRSSSTIPRKPDRPVASASTINVNDRTHKERRNNHNNNNRNNTEGKTRSNNSYHGANQEENVVVLVRNQQHAQRHVIRAALEADLPGKLKFALGRAKLELDFQGDFVVRREPGVRHNYGHVRRILQKQHLPGWLEWLQGRRGWLLAADKQPFLDYHRRLHEAYAVTMLALMKRAEPGLKTVLVVLYYKRDPRALEHGAPARGARQNTQTLWKKVSRGESLQDAVGMLRPFLEVIRYFCTDPQDKWESLPWLEPDVPRGACRSRLGAISRLVSALMRSSEWGPDVPVNWAAHPALNHYPRSVVTESTMIELVVGMANILSHLFLPCPATVSNLEGVDELLPRFSSGQYDAPAATRKGAPKESSTKKNPSSSERAADLPPRPPSVPTDPLVIDLTGLSIED